MKGLRALYHLVRADFLVRVRRYGFLIVLGATLLLGYAVTSGQIVVRLDEYSGLHNSAWVGLLTTLAATVFLSLAGFYVVKGTLARDRRTGVGQIVAATPVSRSLYILSKTLSNLAVLATLVGILVLAAVALQLLRAEDTTIALWPLLSPFLLILMPALAVVAALAVLFETIPWLRGGFGNVTYFFLWALFLTYSFLHPSCFVDVLGLLLVEDVFLAAARAGLLQYSGGVSIEMVRLMPTQTFRWEGIPWTAELILARLYWVAIAGVLVLLAVVLFDRFDPARGLAHRYDLSFQRGRLDMLRWLRTGLWLPAPSAPPEEESARTPVPAQVTLTPLVRPLAGSRLRPVGHTLLAELRLLLKGQRWWWYAVALGLVVAGLLVPPFESGRQIALPLAWLWPVLLWSALGVREARHHTGELVFCATHPLRRQLPATWLAGVILALLTGSGAAVRLVLGGNWAALTAWSAGALFIPTLALALGCWSGSSKPFEAVYVALWYAGPINGLPALDFMGALPEAVAGGVCWYYLALTGLLLALAALGRWRQVRTVGGG